MVNLIEKPFFPHKILFFLAYYEFVHCLKFKNENKQTELTGNSVNKSHKL